ncbi:MAG: polysaccharide biosynthesis/export family protein [Chitinophagaceae bacterium]|nr:polysaccharide biosynthesis/export family protein [Chitinophagaceae bacterium]
MKLKTVKILYLVPVVLFFLSASCVDTKNVAYFNTVTETTIASKIPVPESVIQKNDLLSITVSSLNPEATAIFNPANASANTIGSANGYLVSADGSIQFPILGNIKAEGFTKEQLKAEITKKLIESKLLTDPIVSIRFLNFRITVLGEVKNPSVVTVPNEKISLLEAIGMAGDLTIYAKRSNVLLIREEGGNKMLKRLNLNSDELLTSPYYYLKSNDIVYVEPDKTVVKASRSSINQSWISLGLGSLSLLIIILDRLIL